MKRVAGLWLMICVVVMYSLSAIAQSKIDDTRMERDIEVAENVLSTLIRQHLDIKRSIFPLNVEGSYAPGYGVTFKVPSNALGPMIWGPVEDMLTVDEFPGGFRYTVEDDDGEVHEVVTTHDGNRPTRPHKAPVARRKRNSDSVKLEYNQKIIDAAKEFIADYGDMITQLAADEKIVITNRGEGQRIWVGAFVDGFKQSYLSVEGLKSDVNQFKQGKISRDQLLSKIKVINSEMDDELQPDLELLTSIFNRLYQRDLSKSYFTEDNVYYERLKGYGVIYYMQVYSSNPEGGTYVMPTIHEEGLSQDERDEKVKELYPVFDKSIREDILEYGRTVKSLKEDESLVFNITLTKCHGCGIPSSVEYAVKKSVLSDYAAGKISKDAALGKITVKKGANQ